MTKSMTSGKPVKLILLFALPLIVGNIFQQFYSMADTVIVGRTIGVNALAAVGCTGSVSFFILGFVMGFTSGLSILIAQRFGAEDEEGIRCSFAAGIILSIALTIVMTLFAVALVRPAMEFLQTPEEILDDAVSYIRIIFWGIGASVLFNLGSNTMRALGDSRTPLYFLIFACCVNIVLDILCDTGSSPGDPCDISLLGGRCQYTVPADAGCRTGRSFNRDPTTVFSGKCTDDGAIYKRRTAGNVLSNYIPSATGWSQFY